MTTTSVPVTSAPSAQRATPETPDAFVERIYRAEFARLVGLGRLLTGSTSAGEDLAHEVFVDALERVRCDPDYLREPVWPWLRAALVNRAAMRRRQAARELLRLIRLYQAPMLDEGWHERTLDFVRVLATLPPRMRACVVLHYCEDLSLDEVAATLGCASRTVETQLRKGRKRLVAALGEDAEGADIASPLPVPGDRR